MYVRYTPKRSGEAPPFWAEGMPWSQWPAQPAYDKPEPSWLFGSEYSVFSTVVGYDWADQLVTDLRKLSHRCASRLIRERTEPLPLI